MTDADDLRAAISHVEGVSPSHDYASELADALETALSREVPDLDCVSIRELRAPESIRLLRAEMIGRRTVRVGILLELVISASGLHLKADASTRAMWAARLAQDPICDMVDSCDDTDAEWKTPVVHHDRASVLTEVIVDLQSRPKITAFCLKSVQWAESAERSSTAA